MVSSATLIAAQQASRLLRKANVKVATAQARKAQEARTQVRVDDSQPDAKTASP